MKESTIEQKVGKAVLQAGEEILVGNKKYTVAPPSVATLILASEAISTLPAVRLDNGKIVEESLYVARECSIIGDIIAIFILGAQRGRKHGLSAFLYRRRRKRLANALLCELTPTELHNLLALLLRGMQIGDFFGLTTFLSEINLIRPTKVVNETTAFGQ